MRSNAGSSFNPRASSSMRDSRRPYSEESWVEVTSRPSSSSLSSAATDEIVTTGLRVANEPNTRRRRRPRHPPSALASQRRPSFGSSQEEYDETESEEDQVMTSSNENISESQHQSSQTQVELEDEDDENATALGVSDGTTVFAPQPHAFSPPPSSITNRHQMSQDSYFPRTNTSSRSTLQPRRTVSQPHSRTQHSPFSAFGSTHQPDHDAALRASLTTLLSCAAAARGLPKQDQSQRTPSTRVEPTTLRIVPESALLGSAGTTRSPSSPSSRSVSDKGKRKAPAVKSTKDQRAAKKAKRVAALSDETMISPTMLTWMVSAGLVVLVSAIGFSAGYAMGWEAGKAEAGFVSEGGCGKEAVKGGLKRLRWSSSGAGSVRV